MTKIDCELSPLAMAPSRRRALGLFSGALLLGGVRPGWTAQAEPPIEEDVLTEAAVLRDPDIPVAGNPNGDITIVEFSDYQCPYCRKVAPELRALVREDGKIRMVFKDWPVFGGVSIVAARLVLACKYQDKFVPAHEALIGLTSRLTEGGAKEALAKAGIDVERAARDLDAHGSTIDAILKRSDSQAKAFGFNGTPSYIIGKFRVPGALTKQQFALAVADARKALAGKK